MRAAVLGVLAALAVVEARAGDDPGALKAENSTIVAAAAGSAGVFTVRDDGAVRHVQSGLVCPAKYPNVVFYQVYVYAPDGTDVGCDYRRADAHGGAWSKLTIFAVKAAPDATVDRAYERFRREVEQTYPDALPQGEAIRIENKGAGPSTFPPIRSQEYLIRMNDQTYTTDLIVTISKGWIVELRATYVGLPNTMGGTNEGGSQDALVAEGGDRLMGPKALIDALGTIGQ